MVYIICTPWYKHAQCSSGMSRAFKLRYELGAGRQARLPRGCDVTVESGKVKRRYLGKEQREAGEEVAYAKTDTEG